MATPDNTSQVALVPNSGPKNITFNPVKYQFRVTQKPGGRRTYALQVPFATQFDNLISVLWSVYNKKSKIKIGANPLHWALEFLRCMEMDYSYPESIGKIVNALEDQLITLYARVGTKIQEDKKIQKEKLEKEQEQEKDKDKDKDKKSKSSKEAASTEGYTSYNEEDIMIKLGKLKKMPIDQTTGDAKYLKELNSLGKKKPKQDSCAKDKKTTATKMITALQKIQKKTSEVATKTGIEELIKELKV